MAVAFGRYQLLKKIAAGGMGQVFLARTAQMGFEKLVVIKRILPHLVEDEEFLEMFFDEAKIAARLNHPNLAQIFDLDQVNGMHYLAMEYVAGDDVRRVEKAARKQQKPLPLGAACRIIADAAAGLDYAHKVRDPHGAPLNLIHRDVSPQNILVGFDGGVKLIDFGVARAVGRAQHTATGILKGKYPYMSPEQIAGEEYDHRSDQFALAIVFWEILTGRRLFKGDSDLVTMRLVRECNVPTPSDLNPSLPKALDAIVLKALSPKPQDRFPDTGAFRMALEEFTVSNGIAATPAHLAAYMRDLYAERIEHESDISALDELTGPSAFDEDSKPSDSRASALPADAAAPKSSARSVARPNTRIDAPPPRAVTQATAHVTQAMTHPGSKSRKGLGVAAISAAAVLIIGLAVAVPVLLKDPEPQPPAPTATTSVPPPTATVAEPPPAVPVPAAPPTTTTPATPTAAQANGADPSALLLVSLTSNPVGAEVRVDGKPVGKTPVSYRYDPSAAELEATITLAGYEPQKVALNRSTPPTIEVELKKRKRVQTKPDDGRSLGIKTGR